MTKPLLCENRRRSLREKLNATTALRIGRDEVLCKACDISEDGLGVIVRDAGLESHRTAEADVLLGDVVRRFRGIVVYAKEGSGGDVRAGIHFSDAQGDPDALGSSAGAGGTGTWGDGSSSNPGVFAPSTSAPRRRRATERRKTGLAVEVEPGRRAALVENLSETGAFLWSPVLRSPGQELRLTIRSARGVEHMVVTVKWTKRPRGNDPFGGRTGMGVAFATPLRTLDDYLGSHRQLL